MDAHYVTLPLVCTPYTIAFSSHHDHRPARRLTSHIKGIEEPLALQLSTFEIATMASQSGTLRAAVSYLKLPGTLSIDNTHLSWAPSSSSTSASSLNIPLTHIVGLSVSKAGAASTVMGLALAPDTPGAGGKTKAMLYFTPDTKGDGNEVKQRDQIKDHLSPIVAENKDRQAAQQTPAASSPVPAPAPGTGPATASSVTATATSTRAAASPATAQSSTPSSKTKSRVTELDLRYRVLRANPQLASLHRDLVMSGELKDAEFWDHPTRRALLGAERAAAEQTMGRNARIADPRPRTDERGEMRVEITPQLKRDLFEQYPVVRRAWEENVPKIVRMLQIVLPCHV